MSNMPAQNKMIPAVILSCHTMGLGVVRSLGIMGVPIIVVYYEKGDMGYVSKYVKEKVFAPHPEHSEEQFISLLIDCARRFGRCVLIPVDDATLLTVSKNKKLLEDKYIVACTDWKITQQFLDKKLTYTLAESIGVPAPKTIVPKSFDDVEQYGDTVQFPCLVKPSLGHRYFELFRKKMVQVDNFDQLISAYRQASEANIEVMLHELIPGDDTQGVNYNSYFIDGEPYVEFTAEKVRLSPPGFGVPRVAVSKDIPEIIEPGRKILKALGFNGYSCTEFKKDTRDGVYKFMEVNGRHNRSVLLAVRCGINFPWLEYNYLTQGELPSKYDYERGIYWIDEFRDISHSVKYIGREGSTLNQYIRPYLRDHVFATFAMDDPKPFMRRCLDLLRMAFQNTYSLLKLIFTKRFLNKKTSED